MKDPIFFFGIQGISSNTWNFQNTGNSASGAVSDMREKLSDICGGICRQAYSVRQPLQVSFFIMDPHSGDGEGIMRPVLYIDVLFLVNWMMDAVILILTGRFLKRRIRLWAVSIAAAAGAIWVCLCAAFSLSGVMIQVMGMIPVAVLMVVLAYPSREVREIFRGYLCFYLAAILTGGLLHIVYDNTVLGRFWQLWMAKTEAGTISVWLLAIAMACSFAVITLGIRYREASRNREQIQEVTLHFEGRQLTVRALWDSGNQLHDPFTGKAVHILERETAKTLFPAGLQGLPVRVIPCRSLGKAHGLLPVITLDSMTLENGKTMEKPVIGFSSVLLSADRSYQMLLHAQTDEKRRN